MSGEIKLSKQEIIEVLDDIIEHTEISAADLSSAVCGKSEMFLATSKSCKVVVKNLKEIFGEQENNK